MVMRGKFQGKEGTLDRRTARASEKQLASSAVPRRSGIAAQGHGAGGQPYPQDGVRCLIRHLAALRSLAIQISYLSF